MAWSLVASTTTTGTNASSSIDTTGADLLVVSVTTYQGNGTCTDNKSNTWTKLTPTSNNPSHVVWYCHNPTVGTGHTFQFSGFDYQGAVIAAFSGSHSTSTFDAEATVSITSGSTGNSGSITPSVDGCLILSSIGLNVFAGQTVSVSSFTQANKIDGVGGVNYGDWLFYAVQTSAAAINPALTFSESISYCAKTVSFKPASGGSADVTTSGSIGGISLSATTGSATGSATTSGSIGSISLSAATGSATSSVSATADIKAVSLSAFAGSATGSATATGAVNSVSLSAATGTASAAGDVTADGAIAALSLSVATGAATGTAAVSGSLAAVSLGAATGTATVSISVAGSLPVISLTAATGAASTGGDVVASAGLPALSLSAPTGASTGTATTSAALATISLSAATGTASAGADVSASGSIAVIGLTAPLGTATISIEAQAVIAAVFMSVPTGVATGSATCSGAMSAISLSACRGAASNGLEDLPYLSQMVFARTFEQREFARISDGRYFVRRS